MSYSQSTKRNIYLNTNTSIIMSKNNILHQLNNYNYTNSNIEYFRIKYYGVNITTIQPTYKSKYDELIYDMTRYIPINKLRETTLNFKTMINKEHKGYYWNHKIGHYIQYTNTDIIMKEILRLCNAYDYTIEGKITLYSGETISFII